MIIFQRKLAVVRSAYGTDKSMMTDIVINGVIPSVTKVLEEQGKVLILQSSGTCLSDALAVQSTTTTTT